MKKQLLALCLALAMLLALTACGGGAASSAPAESGASVSAPEETVEPEQEMPVPEEPALPAEEASAEVSSEEPEEEPEEPEIVIEYPLFDDVQTYTIWFSNSPDLSEIINDMNEYLVFRELEKVTNVAWAPPWYHSSPPMSSSP